MCHTQPSPQTLSNMFVDNIENVSTARVKIKISSPLTPNNIYDMLTCTRGGTLDKVMQDILTNIASQDEAYRAPMRSILCFSCATSDKRTTDGYSISKRLQRSSYVLVASCTVRFRPMDRQNPVSVCPTYQKICEKCFDKVAGNKRGMFQQSYRRQEENTELQSQKM